MECLSCDIAMMVRRKAHRYSECGLDYVVLLDVEVAECPACGDREVALSRIQELHRVIALEVAQKPGRLAGNDVRFLRKYLGLSSADLGKELGTRPETVSRWENDHRPMGFAEERLLRLMVFNQRPATHYPREDLQCLTETDKKQAKIRVKASGNGWAIEAK